MVGKARFINVSTRTFGVNSPVVIIPGDENEIVGRKISYLPSFSRTYSLWYKGHYINVTRSEVNEGAYHTKETLEIRCAGTFVTTVQEDDADRNRSIFARSHSMLNELLLEAKKAYLAAEEYTISIYVSES